jgi:hypothetical protein
VIHGRDTLAHFLGDPASNFGAVFSPAGSEV